MLTLVNWRSIYRANIISIVYEDNFQQAGELRPGFCYVEVLFSNSYAEL